MSDTTRRNFLVVAGAGAAGVAAASVALAGPAAAATARGGAAAKGDSKSPDPSTELPPDASGPLVAYVGDVRNGHISVMVGEREVVVRDPDLVARLASAAEESD